MPALLCPTPQIYRPSDASFPAPSAIGLAQEGEPLFSPDALDGIGRVINNLLRTEESLDAAPAEASPPYPVTLVKGEVELPDAYKLKVTPEGASVRAASAQGAHHALATLCQLCIASTVRACRIEDAPMLPVRGYMLDISRDRVPNSHTIGQLIDWLWLLKFNQLQLYVEHSFAFPGHERVWGMASPLDDAFIHWLQQQCELRGLELVPNFNSLGHFERWLKHKDYIDLAETPGGTVMPNGRVLEHCTTLAPGPRTNEFLRSLYAEYLPLFKSGSFNAGLDEPWELGMGRSRERCQREGKHRVYLDHLRDVAALSASFGKKLQFWADIVLEAPWAVQELPEGVTGLVWGYEADHPFEEQAEHFAQSGVPFLLCPGTSTWNSFGGRWPTAEANIRNCVSAAIRNGALGILLTDWGDNGHHQPPSASLPALALAAQLSWSAREGVPVSEVVDSLLLRDPEKRMGMAILGLGSAWTPIPRSITNASWLYRFLFGSPADRKELMQDVSVEDLEDVSQRLEWVEEELAAAEPMGSYRLATVELTNAAGFLDCAITLALAAAGRPVETPGETLGTLTRLIGEYETIWSLRNWPGGLHESSARLRKLLG